MQKRIDKLVWSKLQKVGRELTGAAPGSRRNHDFCFHMTDWIDDLKALASLMESPSAANGDQWESVVHGFLIHASGHILAASKLARVKPIEFELPRGDSAEGKKTRAAEPAA